MASTKENSTSEFLVDFVRAALSVVPFSPILSVHYEMLMRKYLDDDGFSSDADAIRNDFRRAMRNALAHGVEPEEIRELLSQTISHEDFDDSKHCAQVASSESGQ